MLLGGKEGGEKYRLATHLGENGRPSSRQIGGRRKMCLFEREENGLSKREGEGRKKDDLRSRQPSG